MLLLLLCCYFGVPCFFVTLIPDEFFDELFWRFFSKFLLRIFLQIILTNFLSVGVNTTLSNITTLQHFNVVWCCNVVMLYFYFYFFFFSFFVFHTTFQFSKVLSNSDMQLFASGCFKALLSPSKHFWVLQSALECFLMVS